MELGCVDLKEEQGTVPSLEELPVLVAEADW